MKKISLYVALMVLTLVSSSCHDMLLYRMDVLRPGYVVVPPDRNVVLLVDHSAPQPDAFGHDVKYAGMVQKDTAFQTSELSGMLLHRLAERMLKEEFYKQITVVNRAEARPEEPEEDDYLMSARLSTKQIKELSRGTDATLLISLDRLLVRTLTNSAPAMGSFRATRDVRTNTVWRVYDLKADTLVSQFQYTDSLFWEAFQPNLRASFKALPEWDNVLPEIADVVAEKMNTHLGPHWETVERKYYIAGSYRMKLAADLVRSGDMDGASRWWLEEYDESSGRNRSRVALNMMLYEEQAGRPQLALDWAKKASLAASESVVGLSEQEREMLDRWKQVLRIRVEELKRLKMSVDGEGN